MSTAPPLTSTAPVIAPPPTRAFWQIVRLHTRLATLPTTSIVGPSAPTSAAEAPPPAPTSSTGFSSLRRSWYSPGWTRIVSKGRAASTAALIVG